jgi:hypothetical protein
MYAIGAVMHDRGLRDKGRGVRKCDVRLETIHQKGLATVADHSPLAGHNTQGKHT